MKKDDKKQFIDNNDEIGRLLLENEVLLKSNGYNPPIENYSVNKNMRIKIPAGYVREKAYFVDSYSLESIIESSHTRDNIAYALQLSDIYNFFINRFKLFGSVETMFCKQVFINTVSVIEALITESAIRCFSLCGNCKKHKPEKCSVYLKKDDCSNMKAALEGLKRLKIIQYDKEKIERLIALYDLRNKVHIRLSEDNEYTSSKFNMDLCNEAIGYLKEIDELLLNEAVPHFEKCDNFRKIR